MICGMKSIQNSLTEIKTAFKATPEPVKIHSENSLSHKVIIYCLGEEKGLFNSSFEADNPEIQNVCDHMDETIISR